jgi:hypothetical protein
VAAGKCDIGIGNTYYWALMMNNDPEKKPWAEATKVILPTFEGGGTHVNLSGVILAKHAPNKANGRQADRVARRRQGAADLRRCQLRIPDPRRRRRQPDHCGLRQAHRRSDADRQDRRQPQGGLDAGGQGRVR